MTPLSMIQRLATVAALAAIVACGAPNADPAPAPVADSAKGPARVLTETVTVRDKDLEQRVSRLELTLLERDAQVEDLQNRLEETRREVVRSMAKVQTLATRAEAASGMAEAEIALQTLRSSRGAGSADVARVSKLLQDATNEFNKQNYGGALYLANQAKSTAGVGRMRSSGDASSLRPGEVPFASPVGLQASSRCKLREGPGTTYRVLATLEAGAQLKGLSHVDQWVRVSTDSGPSGWVFWNLVQRRADAGSK
ncbi:MAG TPA: SH3 domain-containing protein [Gemmatimonadales bacterium]|nr:SH3 domain-containing protein [Gemmatimonadales bacterium]